jgi:hypothetical protein
MPTGAEHPSATEAGKPGIFKGLMVGVTGAGKTGMLASLLDDGYKIRALDFDRGLDPLIGYAKKRGNLANLSYHTLTDEFALRNGFMAIKKAPAFQRALSLLDNWDDFGPVQSWGTDTILLLDTLGSMSKSSYNMVLQANGIVRPSGERGGPEQSHYGAAQDNIERLLLNLTNPDLVPCHVIVNAHWTYQEAGNGRIEPYPETIGKALNPTIGRKFNNLFSIGITAGVRQINVKKDGMIPCKASRPLKNETYPIATGMSDIFKELVGRPPS